MRTNVLTFAATSLFALGVAAAVPAYAGPTADQAAAESDLLAAAPVAPPTADARGQGVIVPGDQGGSPASASNGLAQGRIIGGDELRKNAQ